jgi:hypothetical protein
VRQQQQPHAQHQQQARQQQHLHTSHMTHPQQHYVGAPEYAIRSGITELPSAGTALVASQLGIPRTSQYNANQVGTAENSAYAAATESVGVGQSHTNTGRTTRRQGGTVWHHKPTLCTWRIFTTGQGSKSPARPGQHNTG